MTTETITAEALATEALDWFERRTRDNGEGARSVAPMTATSGSASDRTTYRGGSEVLSDAGITRLLTELDHEPDATCARLGCDYPAPVGPYCGFHTGREIAARDGGKTPPERTYNETRRER